MPKRKKRSTPNNADVNRIIAPRNPYANHPLMRKGGAHEPSKKAKRASVRRETKQLVRDWQSFFNHLFFS